MAKRLTDKQKEEIIESFKLGKTLENLSKEYNSTKLTISRNLKKYLGEKRYKELIIINKKLKLNDKTKIYNNKYKQKDVDSNNLNQNTFAPKNLETNEQFLEKSPFVEIIPLNYKIEHEIQKDLSSIPISSVNLPKLVYMIVDKNIELEIKFLKEYPDWQFLSQEELNRKTIEIYFDLKTAKQSCRKEQKVIKVPNTEVFKIVAPILLSKGISRIISPDKLIAL